MDGLRGPPVMIFKWRDIAFFSLAEDLPVDDLIGRGEQLRISSEYNQEHIKPQSGMS
ncbi:hypothetical protein [Marinobacter sp. C18]|uniref:hypothetical protein n=1 Tax=Marinobacter sp. C18 TaxID=1772288 RepID=UPI000AE4C59E|nr:hypothetical protein [Marinobacter sp. C18]